MGGDFGEGLGGFGGGDFGGFGISDSLLFLGLGGARRLCTLGKEESPDQSSGMAMSVGMPSG